MNSPKELLYDWMGGNEVIFFGINSIHGNYYDQLMLALSIIGNPKYFHTYVAALLAYALILLLVKIILRRQGKWTHITIWIGVFAVLFAGNWLCHYVVYAIKDYFAYPRPFIALSGVELYETIPASEYYRSFPSEHVAFAALWLVALWPVMTKQVAWFGIFFVALMAWARVSTGAHYPVDTIATILLVVPMIMVLREMIYVPLRKLRIKC